MDVEAKPHRAIGIIAAEAASNGGTHYTVGSDDTWRSETLVAHTAPLYCGGAITTVNKRVNRTRVVRAIVYRLERSAWDCAGFRPPPAED